MEKSFLDGRVIAKVGDLTEERVDAIVNAANSTLLGGGGVDGAFHAKGGTAILAECKAIRASEYADGLPTGKAVITTGGHLSAKYVIHTVGPIYGQNGGRDAELLGNCYRNSLELAVSHGLQTIAFPSISCGVYGYPKDEAARVVSSVLGEIPADLPTITEVRLIFFSSTDCEVFLQNSEFPT